MLAAVRSKRPYLGWQRSRRSVVFKLALAFAFISLFSVASAVVGIVSFGFVSDAQTDVLDRSMPLLRTAERFSRSVTMAIDLTPRLKAATQAAALQDRRQELRDSEKEVRRHLNGLRELEVESVVLDRLAGQIDSIFNSLDEVTSEVILRNDLSEAFASGLRIARSQAGRLVAELKPAIVDASNRMLERSDRITALLAERGSETAGLIEEFEALTQRDYYEIERLNALLFRAETLEDRTGELRLAADPGRTAEVRNAMTLDLRAIARMTAEIDDPALRSRLAEDIGRFLSDLETPDNVFDLHQRQFAAAQTMAQLDRLNRVHAVALAEAVENLLLQVEDGIEQSAEEARQVVVIGLAALVVIALLAFVAAVYVIRRFVLLDVGERIRSLAHSVSKLAGGDLDHKVVVTGSDEISEMARAVKVFKQNARELRRSNADLESIVYAASHDLKSPLRGIANLAGWIERDQADHMGDQTRKHMALLRGRIARLDALLDDLLQYSLTGRHDAEVHDLDLKTLLPEMFSVIGADSGLTLELSDDMPLLNTAAAPLELVLRHLIENAIKHRDELTTCITVRMRERGGLFEFSVADDGPGIPVDFHARIFEMFESLQGRDKVEGSGMGLAIIRKQLDTMGCAIVVESDPTLARGTRFRFTWLATRVAAAPETEPRAPAQDVSGAQASGTAVRKVA